MGWIADLFNSFTEEVDENPELIKIHINDLQDWVRIRSEEIVYKHKFLYKKAKQQLAIHTLRTCPKEGAMSPQVEAKTHKLQGQRKTTRQQQKKPCYIMLSYKKAVPERVLPFPSLRFRGTMASHTAQPSDSPYRPHRSFCFHCFLLGKGGSL